MEKIKKTPSSIIFSKELKGKEKILFTLTPVKIIEVFLCFALSFARVFSAMSPFGISFYASAFKLELWSLNFLFTLIGLVLSKSANLWTYITSLTLITIIFAVSEKMSSKTYIKSIVSFLALFISGLVFLLTSSYSSYDIFALFLESLFLGAGVLIFDKGFRVVAHFKDRSFINETEKVCVFAFFALVALCLEEIPAFWGIKPGEVIGIVAILTASFSGDASSSVMISVFLGVAFSLKGSENGIFMGTYAFGALLGGAFKKYGRIGTSLGFVIANCASSIFLSDTLMAVVGVYDSLLASLIFLFLPEKVFGFFDEFSLKSNISTESLQKRETCDVQLKKLRRIASSIGEIGEIYEKVSSGKNIGNGYVKMIKANLCSKVCPACQNKESCWKDDGEGTRAVSEILEKNTAVTNGVSLPSYLRKKCHRTEGFSETLKNHMQIMKAEKQWLSKLNESRKLIASQLRTVSDAIENECENITKSRDYSLEKKIYTQLDILNAKAKDVFAKVKGTEFEAEISFENQNVSKDTKRLCMEALNTATGSDVSFAGFSKSGAETIMKFTSPYQYSCTFGYASKPKTGEHLSGDSFNVIYTDTANPVMALSDGMGSGKQANEESRFVIELLEKFLHAGFDPSGAAKLINSSLLMKGEKDTFATLDLCSINLSDKVLEFTKLGASSAYIKTDEKCIKIKGSSLPLGIVRNESGEKYMLPIDSDLIVVLMSDGVGDIALKNSELEGWIEKELENINSKNPQIVASKLLNTAVKLAGKTCYDDMTVLVGCIARNEGIFY